MDYSPLRTASAKIALFFEDPGKRKVAYLLAVVVVSYLFLFFHLGDYSLKEPDEGRYAEIPREMVEQGDYVVPHLNYVRYFEKPPLLYWLTACSYKVFGISEWSFRFPNALAALLCVVITYLYAARRFSERTALVSSMVLLSSFGFFAMAHIVTTDILFAFLLFASLLAFSEFYHSEQSRFLYLFFTALAFAVLTKGPVALILLGATVLTFLFLEKRISFLKRMVSWKGFLLFALVALPWFAAMCMREKEFFQFFFIDQHILRFLTTKHHRSGPVYYFLPVLFGGLFPWSLYLPRAATRLWRVRELRLFFIWSIVVFCFFSLSGSKLPPYILPMFPAASIILGYFFGTLWRQRIRQSVELTLYGAFFLLAASATFIYGSGLANGYLKPFPDLVDLSANISRFSLGIACVSCVIPIVFAFRRYRRFSTLFYLLGGFSLAIVLGLMLHAHVIDGFNTTKELAQAINRSATNGSYVVSYGTYHQTLPFYTRNKTYVVDGTGELEMGSGYPDAKGLFFGQEELQQLFRSRNQVWVVFKKKKLDQMKKLGITSDGIICRDNRCLISNKPSESPGG